MIRTMFFFVALCCSTSVLAASDSYYQVPIKMDLPPVPTELYIRVNSDAIGLAYDEFKAGKLSASDSLFVKTMDTLFKGSASSAMKLIMPRSGLESEEEVAAYLNTFRGVYKGMTNHTVISKVYYSTGYAYIWAIDVSGRKIATSLYFQGDQNGELKYLDADSIPLVNKVVKDAIVKSYYLPDTYKQKSTVNLDYEVELEDASETPLGVFLSFNAKQTNVHLPASGIDNTQSDLYKNNKLAQFYSKFQSSLDKPNIADTFSKLSKRSKKRLGGIPEAGSETEAEVINFVSNILVPSSIVKVIDIAPFKMIVGTHFTDQYLGALELTDDERIAELSKTLFFYSYLVEKGEDFQFVNVRRYGLLDQVLNRNDFFSKKLMPQILSVK